MNFPATAPNIPPLAPPGQGLPLVEGLLARYFFYPRAMRRYDGAAVLALLDEETQRIRDLVETFDDDSFFTPVLVPRIRGLEDSSRFWSVAMVLEHLVITLRPMTRIAETLARGESLNVTVSTAAVKPKGGRTLSRAAWIEGFTLAAAEAAQRLGPIAARADVVRPPRGAPRVRHPFFGPMEARGWIWLIGAHQALHRRQIEAIRSSSSR